VPVLLVILGFVGAWVGWQVISAIYEKKAEVFDLSQIEKMEAASIIYDREGKELGKIFILNRHPVELANMSPMMMKAVMAQEDAKFYKHNGVDYLGILRAAIANYRRGKISQGASTVTQQLARNSFPLKERTYQRKLTEIFLAQRIEKNFSKEKIMELYLNRVYFGSGFYGVEAAARGYFGRSAKDLTIGQCAMLAGLLKSPQNLSPWNSLEGATQTRNMVLKRMYEENFINGDQLKEETSLPLYVMKRTNPFKVSYAVDFIRQQAIAALGYERAMNGGFRIYTTLDSKMQRTAELALRGSLAAAEQRTGYNHETYEQYRERVKPIEDKINQGNMTLKLPEPKYLQGAVLALDNATGGIRAIVGGRDFKHSEYNRALQAKLPAGTAFTPFVFAAAYEKGIFPGQTVEDACLDNRYVMIGGSSGILGEWGIEKPENEYEGPVSLRDALAKGKNAATMRLGFQIGLDPVKKTAANAGITTPLRDYASTFLGSTELTLEELTLAYTTFPNGGSRPKQPYIIDKITDGNGGPIYLANPKKVLAMSAEAAFQVNVGLGDSLRSGSGDNAFTEAGLRGDLPAAGKTGTAYNFTDAWFLGYDSSVTCGVWIGFDRPTRIYRGAFGRDLALPVWAKVMNAAAEDFPAVKFPKPDTLTPVEICRSSGLLATPQCNVPNAPGTYIEYATKDEMPHIRCDVHGGGIRNYAKEYNQEEWPRAAAAIDLATIRPVAVIAPTLLGLSDVYSSVRPAALRFDDPSIPVARAVAVHPEGSATPSPDGAAPEGAPTPIPLALPADPEVRKAEPVKPLDSNMDAPALKPSAPPPLSF